MAHKDQGNAKRRPKICTLTLFPWQFKNGPF